MIESSTKALNISSSSDIAKSKSFEHFPSKIHSTLYKLFFESDLPESAFSLALTSPLLLKTFIPDFPEKFTDFVSFFLKNSAEIPSNHLSEIDQINVININKKINSIISNEIV